MNDVHPDFSPPRYDEASFKTYRKHMRLTHLLGLEQRRRPPGFRKQPELVRLDVAPSVAPSGKPPVRIFVGTEPAQHRAERVLVWSIMAVRDPSRAYEIHLMKDLAGFDRRYWKTGFTAYRYAIPTLAGGQGRAIYNDVDQIYLADPAELFDLDMGGAGMLSITERETSVMLLDCERMIKVWDIEDAKAMRLHKPFRIRTNAVPGLWGPLRNEWNARDFEFEPGRSKLLHFTILHTQPWQPFPRQLKYEPHSLADIWLGMERAADASAFTIFTKERPSHLFRCRPTATGPRELPARHRKSIEKLIRETNSITVCDFKPLAQSEPGGSFDEGALNGTSFDGVVSFEALNRVPEDDVPWMLDDVFGRARKFVYVAISCGSFVRRRADKESVFGAVPDSDWWRSQMECAARRHPGIRWVLRV